MHIYPAHLPVAGLLGGALTLQVPRFQRNYAWTTTEIGAFLRDLDLCHQARLSRNTRHHFFGGLVTAQSPVQGSTRQNLEVIDGQQRLATFLMLAVQLKRAMENLSEQVDRRASGSVAEFLRARAAVLQERYEVYKDSISLQVISVPRLLLSKPDQNFFAELLRGGNPHVERESHRLLRTAFDSIGDHLQRMLQGGSDADKARALDTVHDVFEKDWTVIHMAATERKDAHMLFQVLNDRGAGLTEGELLRAATLEALEPIATAGQLQSVEDSWNEILRGEASSIRQALQWIYASQVGGYPGKTTLLADLQRAMFPMLRDGEPLERQDGQSLISVVQAIQKDMATLDLLAQGEWPCAASSGVGQWDRDRLRLLIVHLKRTECVPLLISAAALSATVFSEIVQALERFFFRYALADGPRDKVIDTVNRHAVDIRKDPQAYQVKSLMMDLRDLIRLHAPDDVFKDRLQQLRYPRSESKKPLKYFLMTLEHYVRWFNEGANGRPVCRDKVRVLDFENGTIEHVYPENATQPDVQLDPLLDTLGNLTFLSPPENDAAGAKSFADKKAYLENSASTLNREIAAEQNWTAQVVRRRQDRLIDIAARVFCV